MTAPRTSSLASPPNNPRRSRLRYLLAAVCMLAVCCNISLAEKKKPLKVFVLVGQSNMQGHAHVRTLDHIGMDPKTAPILREIQDASGKPRVHQDIWISYLSAGGEKKGRLTTGFGANDEKIGPELTFGIYMHKTLQEPILIIKTAWGGKSLHTDFRPPSAGAYEFNEQQLAAIKKRNQDLAKVKADRAKATGHYYKLTVDHVKKVLANIKDVYPQYDPQQGHQLAGLVWFQGWNDMVDRGTYPQRGQKGGYDQYSKVFTHFIRDIRKDLSAPRLPIVIGVMGAGGPVEKYLPPQQRYKDIHRNFRLAMAAPASLQEFKGNVTAVLTENYWDMELVALRARDAKINQQVRKLRTDGKLTRKEERATRDKLRAKEFSDRELKSLTTGVSNFEFHYLGSAKILAQIGKGFAEALTDLRNK